MSKVVQLLHFSRLRRKPPVRPLGMLHPQVQPILDLKWQDQSRSQILKKDERTIFVRSVSSDSNLISPMTHWASSKHQAQVWDRAFHQNQRGVGLVVLIQIYRRFQRSKSVPISESASIVFKGSGCPRHGLLTTIKISAPRNCGHGCVEIVWLMYAVQVLPPPIS